MVALAPDVILARGSAAAGPLLQVTHTVPIVFVIVPDPVALDWVDRAPWRARPGRSLKKSSAEAGLTASNRVTRGTRRSRHA
jgi:hypothetical protein